MGKKKQDDDAFQVDPVSHYLGGFVSRHKRLWIRLGNLETWMLKDELAGIAVHQPIYIAGLARSGSTILLELLARHHETASHRYRDYPLLFTPHFWNRYLERTPRPDDRPAERTHKDGIFITPESPEAFEEVLWMAFFPEIHDPAESSVLDSESDHEEFERFYRDHIRKLLFVRGARRYLSKGNYNITRLEYLLRIFPDARFIIPVREPLWHIASLMKQHRLFLNGQKDNPRAVAHLRRVGHFEFGVDRRPINTGDAAEIENIMALWQSGAEIEGWARYWSHIHNFLADRLARNPLLKEAARVVRYEDLCRAPGEAMAGILSHCGLPPSDELLETAEKTIRFPAYYRPDFTPRQLDRIETLTADAAARFGLEHHMAEAAVAPPA